MKNYSEAPLVTAIIRTHDGDAHLAAGRAIPSVLAQDISPDLMNIIVVSDGPLTEHNEGLIAEALNDTDHSATLLASEKKYGYYCVPSNLATIEASTPYIAYLDADNEWRPSHIPALLDSIRLPAGTGGWPHFVYARRTYVRDKGAPENLPEGDSPAVSWTGHNVDRLLRGPLHNFIDSSDFLIPKSVLFWLAEQTGSMWNPEVRRFGDWELFARIASIGLRGRVVDNVSHIYHWTGNNLQLTRKASQSDMVMEPSMRRL